jgi:hypothetical protein
VRAGYGANQVFAKFATPQVLRDIVDGNDSLIRIEERSAALARQLSASRAKPTHRGRDHATTGEMA